MQQVLTLFVSTFSTLLAVKIMTRTT